MGDDVKGPTRWVVWGSGSPIPEGMFDVQVGDEGAEQVAEQVDPSWDAREDIWLVVVSATENELRAWAEQNDGVAGFAPYEGSGAAPKVEQHRPY